MKAEDSQTYSGRELTISRRSRALRTSWPPGV
jgi:hypothetical protein